jgi:hypothetical protein
MPAPAVITCPACKKRFKGKPELGGKKIKCPKCAEPFVVPNEDAAPKREKVAASKASNEITFDAPVNEDAYGVGKVDLWPRCPHCAQEMETKDAVICLNCGFNTMTRQLGQTIKLQGLTRTEHFLYLFSSLMLVALFIAIVILLVYYDVLMTQRLASLKWASWVTHESLRFWTTIVILALLWTIGKFAFDTLALQPVPSQEYASKKKIKWWLFICSGLGTLFGASHVLWTVQVMLILLEQENVRVNWGGFLALRVWGLIVLIGGITGMFKSIQES